MRTGAAVADVMPWNTADLQHQVLSAELPAANSN